MASTTEDTLRVHFPDHEPAGGWLEHWYALWDEDLEYQPLVGSIYDHGLIHGRDAMRRHTHDWLDIIEDLQLSPIEVLNVGEGRVAVLFRLTGRARGSSVLIRQRIAAVMEYRDGKLIRGHEYRTLKDAVQALGLELLGEEWE